MIYSRWAHAVVPLHTQVFAIGGFVNPESAGAEAVSLASVEKFCLDTHEWKEVAGMREARAFCGATAIQDQFLYVVGGYSGNKMLETFERFDDILGCWTTLATRLPLPMSKIGVSTLVGTPARIVILGGLDPGYARTSWASKFDVTVEAYADMPEMTTGRIFGPGSGVHVVDGRNLVAIGGAASDTCEYCPLLEQLAGVWTELPTYALPSDDHYGKPLHASVGHTHYEPSGPVEFSLLGWQTIYLRTTYR